MPTETAATEPRSVFERPKRSSARLAATWAPQIAAQRVPRRPGGRRSRDRRSARQRAEVGHGANRPSDQALDLDRPAALPSPARLPVGALAGRRRQERVLGGQPAAAGVAQPARNALLDGRRAEDLRLALRPEHCAVRLLEEVELDVERTKLVRPPPLSHAAASSSRSATCSTESIGSWRKRAPVRRKASGSSVVRKRHSPSRAASLSMRCARAFRDLARGLLRREDERHVAAEDTLQDGTDQRVVRAAEDDRVDSGRLQRLRVLTDGLDGSRAVRVVALDERHERRARDRHDLDAGVERAKQRDVPARGDRGFRREQADAAVARRLHGGVRLGRDHADDGNGELGLEIRQGSRGRGVARDDDQLDAVPLEPGSDLEREPPDLGQRARAVRESRCVAEIHEVLVRQRDEQLVQDGEPAHARVEDADRTCVHPRAILWLGFDPMGRGPIRGRLRAHRVCG